MREGLRWLVEHRPAEPARLSICHRDFHALNVLFADGEVTGIVDWGGLLVADPVFDVANTVMLLTIPGRLLKDDLLERGMRADALDTSSFASLAAPYLSEKPD